MTTQPNPDAPKPCEDHERCDVCGAHDATGFGDRRLCTDCYVGCGSCCPEFGKDDLWPAALEDR
jgi:hypothetical protein